MEYREFISNSQVGQDYWVYGEVFNEKVAGFFLDVGAHDGLELSNTYILEKKYKWKGICIEANQESYKELKKIRSCTAINSCISDKKSVEKFAVRGMFGGIISDDCDNKKSTNINTDISVIETVTLAEVLQKHNAPNVIDYLSIDIEGAEDKALLSFPFSDYTFNCITIERPSLKLRKKLRDENYQLVKEIPDLDCYYVHNSFMSEYKKNLFNFGAKRINEFSAKYEPSQINISLIIPAFNCEEEIEKHLVKLSKYFKLFSEIICVVSHSEDKTYEIAKKFLDPHKGITYERKRGLYESWNDAIEKSSGDYVYISTIGDLPKTKKFRDFIESAVKHDVDLAISPPDIYPKKFGSKIKWPIHRIIEDFNLKDKTTLQDGVALDLNRYSLNKYGFCSLSGSFASNLTKRNLLIENPFPTGFHGAGDVVWFAQICSKAKILIDTSSTVKFIRHEKSYPELDSLELNKLSEELNSLVKFKNKDSGMRDQIQMIKSENRQYHERYHLARYFHAKSWRNKFAKRKLRKAISASNEALYSKIMKSFLINN